MTKAPRAPSEAPPVVGRSEGRGGSKAPRGDQCVLSAAAVGTAAGVRQRLFPCQCCTATARVLAKPRFRGSCGNIRRTCGKVLSFPRAYAALAGGVSLAEKSEKT